MIRRIAFAMTASVLALLVAPPAAFAAARSTGTDGSARAEAASPPVRPGASAEPRSAPGAPTSEAQRQRNHMHEYLGLLSDAGQAVIQMSQTAQERAATDRVRDYAKEVREDYQRLRERAAKLALANGVDLGQPWPDTPKEEQDLAQIRATATGLRDLGGDRFDREYLLAAAGLQDQLLRELEIDRNNADGDGRAFLDDVVPSLRDRAEQARALARGIGPTHALPLPAR